MASSIDFQSLLYGPLYSTFSTDCEFISPFNAEIINIRGIDCTDGIMINDFSTGLPTLKPVLKVMAADLFKYEIKAEFMRGVHVTLNNREWVISDVQPFSNPNGEMSDEVALILAQPSELRSPSYGS